MRHFTFRKSGWLFSLVGLMVPALGWCQSDAETDVSAMAAKIHAGGMLFDGHNDLPWTMRTRGGSSFDQVDIAQSTTFHTDIPRLREGGLKAQFWSVYVPAGTDLTGNALLQTLEQIELVHQMCQRYPDVFEMAATAADIERIVKEGKIASMIGVEGGHSIENSLQALRELYRRGARYMTLTHSKTLGWADSATDEPLNNGLSPFGQEVIREMNRLGMLVDLSHVSEKCMRDALAITQAPVIYSHSSARAICDHPRNVSDELLRMTADNGGVVMVNFMSGYVVPTDHLEADRNARGTCGTVCDHIEHIIKVAGVDHVGIGSDYDGVSRLPAGLEDVSCYPRITEELVRRGYSESEIHKILGGNVLRVLRQAEAVAARLKAERVSADPGETLFQFEVAAGEIDRRDSVVKLLLEEGENWPPVVTLTDPSGKRVLGQLGVPSIAWGDAGAGKLELTFLLDELDAGQTLAFTATREGLNPHVAFQWHQDGAGEAELRYSSHGVDKPMLQYMYAPLDESTPETREATYKVFHHTFTPRGDRLLTKGPGGLYPHHRGLFYGFNRITHGGGQKADVWHCKNGASQTHEQTLLESAGPVYGRQTVRLSWRGEDGEPFATETREMTVYRIGDQNQIDFCSLLETTGGDVRLDGDPQHAGFQFRATQEVPDHTKGETFYIRPDGQGKPGEFRNWSAKKDETELNRGHVNLPWNAMCIRLPVADGEETSSRRRPAPSQFTIGYLDHPENPKPARFSERDYGRFGSYFEYSLRDDQPLLLQYRVTVGEGVGTPESLDAAARDFTQPVLVTTETGSERP